MQDFHFSPAARLARAIRDRQVSAHELLEHFIGRVESVNPAINAVVATDFENARRRAHELDDALARGEIRGPLHGLPMTIKDSIEVVGMPCTSGAPKFAEHMPKRNADVVDALIDAGAVIFGKTNLPLFAQDFQSYNDVYGQTDNPWDRSRVPGGSSGGAAAALAAGLTCLEIGSDIGGSIRNPAHFCGVYGHKPSFDIVPMRGHIPPPPGLFSGDYDMSGDIAVLGPMARSAEDLDLLMDILTAPRKSQRIAWTLKLPAPRRQHLKDYRVGVWLDDPDFPVDRQVGDCLARLVDRLAAAGVQIFEKRPNIRMADCYDIYTKLMTAVPNPNLSKEIFAHFQEEAPRLDPADRSFRAQLMRGATLLHRDWIVLDFMRLHMRQQWADFFTDMDVLLCPTVPVTAFAHDHSEFFDRTLRVNGEDRPYMDTMAAWVGLAAAAYLPATVAPAGTAADGLPVGVQIVGPYLEDRTPIHFARLMADVAGGFTPPPGI